MRLGRSRVTQAGATASSRVKAEVAETHERFTPTHLRHLDALEVERVDISSTMEPNSDHLAAGEVTHLRSISIACISIACTKKLADGYRSERMARGVGGSSPPEGCAETRKPLREEKTQPTPPVHAEPRRSTSSNKAARPSPSPLPGPSFGPAMNPSSDMDM